MENGGSKGDVPEDANAHCPGTQSEEAGKADSCAGCPNQQICATAPKGPDPDAGGSRGARKRSKASREIVEEETEFEEEVMALPSRRSKIPATQGGRGGREGGTKRSAGRGSAPPPCPPSSGRTKSCSSGPSRPKKLSDIREIVEEETEFEEEVMALPSRRSKIPATQGGRGGREGGTKRSAGSGSAPPPCPSSSGRTKSCSSGPSRPKKLSDIREIVEEETEFEEEVMALPSRRSKIPATQGGRGGREGGTKRSAGRGSAPPPCPPSSGRTKSCSSGPSGPKKLSDISDSEFRSLRIDNPYARNRDESREDSLFYNDFQERVYHEVLMTNIQMVVPQLWIDMEHINKNLDYFAEAKEICSNLGLFPIMEFQHDYEPLLIAQFYATAHFSTGRTRKITWMTQGAIKEATLAEFAAILGYEDRGRNTPCGFRCHLRKNPAKKDVLAPLYIQGRGIPGKIKDLLPTYDILHRIFRETVAPRAGNKDEIHGFSVDLLFNTFLNRDSGTALDVMDYIWNEMVAAAHSRRVPPFAPYIMALIVAKCPPIARTLSTHPLIVHRPKALKLKKHSKPRNVKGQEVDEEENVIEADSEDADSGRDADFVVSWRKNAQPSWAKRMEAKLKKIFYFQVDNQKRMYKAHVYAKKACARQKEMMEAQGLTISAGSETNITPEEQWISKHSHWDDDVSSSHRAPSTYDEEDFDDEED